jgi:hypothetical protein
MNVINDIQKSWGYDFGILYECLYDKLYQFVNIFDKVGNNLLLWLIKNNCEKDALLLIDKYGHLFEDNKNNNNNRHSTLFMKIIYTANYNVIIKFIKKCKNICDIHKKTGIWNFTCIHSLMVIRNMKLLYIFIEEFGIIYDIDNYSDFIIDDYISLDLFDFLLNTFGTFLIINKNKNKNKINIKDYSFGVTCRYYIHGTHEIIYDMYILNFYGVLYKPIIYDFKYGTVNKFILVFGKY